MSTFAGHTTSRVRNGGLTHLPLELFADNVQRPITATMPKPLPPPDLIARHTHTGTVPINNPISNKRPIYLRVRVCYKPIASVRCEPCLLHSNLTLLFCSSLFLPLQDGKITTDEFKQAVKQTCVGKPYSEFPKVSVTLERKEISFPHTEKSALEPLRKDGWMFDNRNW